MKLSEKLVCLRKEKKLSQFDVAEALHVSRQAISKWESGSSVPSTDNLKFLSDLYDVTVDFLLDDSQTVQEREEHLENKSESDVLRAETGKNRNLLANKQRLKRVLFAVIVIIVVISIICIFYLKNQSQKFTISEVSGENLENVVGEEFGFTW